MDKYLNTEEKILTAAIELFPLKGEVTTREIARAAGVNVAAINYHFKSKNNLMRSVEKHYSSILYEVQSKILMDSDSSPRDRLVNWANTLMEYMFKWPALITLVSNLVLEDKDYNPEIINRFFSDRKLMENVQEIISNITGIGDSNTLNYRYVQLFSGVIGPIIFQLLPMVSNVEGNLVDFNKKEERIGYINCLVDSILNID
ncbi:MAG: TetR/AcrR family transcriptional regulator [Tissierellaceae bacterium]